MEVLEAAFQLQIHSLQQRELSCDSFNDPCTIADS